MKKELKLYIGAFIALAIELIVGGISLMLVNTAGIVVLIVGIMIACTAVVLVKSNRHIAQYNQAMKEHDYQQAMVIADNHPSKLFQYILRLDALLIQGDGYHYLELYANADMKALCNPRQNIALYRYYRTKIIYDFLMGHRVMFDQVDSVVGLPTNHDASVYVEAIRSVVSGSYLEALQYAHKLEAVVAKSGNSTQLDQFVMAYINCICYSALGKCDEQMMSQLRSLDYNATTHRICEQEQLKLPEVNICISQCDNHSVYGGRAVKPAKRSRVAEIMLWIMAVNIVLCMLGAVVMISLGYCDLQNPTNEYQAVVTDVEYIVDSTVLEIEGYDGYLIVYDYCVVEGQSPANIAVGDNITYTVEEGFFAVEYSTNNAWYYPVTSLAVDQVNIVTLDSYNAIITADNAEFVQSMLFATWALFVVSTVIVLTRSYRRIQG